MRKVFERRDEHFEQSQAVTWLVNEGKGKLFRRKDGKYLIYVPKDLAEDSTFPFSVNTSLSVKIGFKVGDKKLTIEKLELEEKTDA